MTEDVLQSPDVQLAADSRQTLNYRRDAQNYITQLFGDQFPPTRNGIFNIHMSKGIIVQPHWHTNVTETLFVISGEVVTSVFDPYTQKLLTYRLKPGQVALFPLGWFHWIIAETDHVHLLAIFDHPTPDIVYGSDFLRCTPKEVMQRAYCVNPEAYAEAVAPIRESVVLGPPVDCELPPAGSRHAQSAESAGEHPQAPAPGSADWLATQRRVKLETMQLVEPLVRHGLQETRSVPVEHAWREAAAAAYLIGRGYNPADAHQIVRFWRSC